MDMIADEMDALCYGIEKMADDSTTLWGLMNALENARDGMSPFQTEMMRITCESLNLKVPTSRRGRGMEAYGDPDGRMISAALESFMDTLKEYIQKIIQFIRDLIKKIMEFPKYLAAKLSRAKMQAAKAMIKNPNFKLPKATIRAASQCAYVGPQQSDPIKAVANYKKMYEQLVMPSVHAKLIPVVDELVKMVDECAQPDGFAKVVRGSAEKIDLVLPDGYSIQSSTAEALSATATYSTPVCFAGLSVHITGLGPASNNPGKRGGMIRAQSLAKAGKVDVVGKIPSGDIVMLGEAQAKTLLIDVVDLVAGIDPNIFDNIGKELEHNAVTLHRKVDIMDISTDQDSGKFIMSLVHGVGAISKYSAALVAAFMKITKHAAEPMVSPFRGTSNA